MIDDQDLRIVSISTRPGLDLMVVHMYKDQVDAWLADPHNPQAIADIGFQIAMAYESWAEMNGDPDFHRYRFQFPHSELIPDEDLSPWNE